MPVEEAFVRNFASQRMKQRRWDKLTRRMLNLNPSVGAAIIRIGLWGILYY